MGCNMQYLDIGGGLAIDYDGSKTDFHASCNYTLSEYAADVVATIPAGATDLTLWTLDYRRTGAGPMNPNNWANLPTVPVMHLNVAGVAPASRCTYTAPSAFVRSVGEVFALHAAGSSLPSVWNWSPRARPRCPASIRRD